MWVKSYNDEYVNIKTGHTIDLVGVGNEEIGVIYTKDGREIVLYIGVDAEQYLEKLFKENTFLE